MLKGVVLGIALTIAAAIIGAYFLVRSGFIPANADSKPGRVEVWSARTSLDATLDRYAPKDQNPITATEKNLLSGVDLYSRNCAICHGSAKGNASKSPIAKGLYQTPPQLATDGVEDDPEGFSFWKIKHGIRLTGMPWWRGSFTDEQIWTLALFLKHMNNLPPSVQQAWEQVQNWPLTFQKDNKEIMRVYK